MLALTLFLALGSCVKHDKVLESAKHAFRNNNCLQTLRAYAQSAGCPEIHVVERGVETLIRCHKPDDQRGKFYDNYWFRITPADLTFVKEQVAEIERHTICIDNEIRIEAYPPDEE